MWPNSPAKPCLPRCSVPPATSPPPMPVPSVTSTMSVGTLAGAVQPLGHGGARGVVVDVHIAADARAEQAGDVEVGDAVQVGRGPQHAVVGDQPGHADAELRRTARAIGAARRACRSASAGCRHPAASGLRSSATHVAVVVERDARGTSCRRRRCRPSGPASAHASAHVLSSRTVLRMRPSARRLTNPGSGTTSSIARS